MATSVDGVQNSTLKILSKPRSEVVDCRQKVIDRAWHSVHSRDPPCRLDFDCWIVGGRRHPSRQEQSVRRGKLTSERPPCIARRARLRLGAGSRVKGQNAILYHLHELITDPRIKAFPSHNQTENQTECDCQRQHGLVRLSQGRIGLHILDEFFRCVGIENGDSQCSLNGFRGVRITGAFPPWTLLYHALSPRIPD